MFLYLSVQKAQSDTINDTEYICGHSGFEINASSQSSFSVLPLFIFSVNHLCLRASLTLSISQLQAAIIFPVVKAFSLLPHDCEDFRHLQGAGD